MDSIYQKLLKYVFLVVLVGCAFQASASMTNGTISPTSRTAQLCENVGCTVTTTSPVNFGYFTNTPSSNVSITDTELTGYIWGQSFGWAVLNCSNTTSGCTSANGNFKVSNTTSGSLSGYAWGQNAGWINFGPFSNNTAATVTINASGQFNGYAWSQNNGWIKFDCSDSNYCVETDWRPLSARPNPPSTNVHPPIIVAPITPVVTPLVPPITPPVTPPITPPSPTTTPPTTPKKGPTTSPVVEPEPEPTAPPTITSPTTPPPATSGSTTTVPPINPPVTSPTSGGPSIGSSIGNAISSFINMLTGGPGPGSTSATSGSGQILDTMSQMSSGLSGIMKNPAGGILTRIITAAGIISGAFFGLASVLFANPLSISELVLIPARLWSLLMAALGLKKRNRPWGTVYDSITKQPLDPAYVVLQDLNGNEISTSITDLDGRYGFLVPPGQYRIIANKTNYIFPSKNLADKSSDELYTELYKGEVIEIGEGVITKNIPMDPLKFDWNEFAKKDQNLMRFYSKRDLWMTKLSNILFYFGFAITLIAVIVTPEVYNIVTLILYAVLFVLRNTILKPRPYGNIKTRGEGYPLSFAVIRVFTASNNYEFIHKVADETGKYYCLVPNGNYYVKIEKKNPDASYTQVYTSEVIEVTEGYINKIFEI